MAARRAACSRLDMAVVHVVHDAPCFGRVSVVRWLKRVWRCREPGCPTVTFSERHDLAAPRAVLTSRVVSWAVDALTHDDTTVWRWPVISGWTGIRHGT